MRLTENVRATSENLNFKKEQLHFTNKYTNSGPEFFIFYL